MTMIAHSKTINNTDEAISICINNTKLRGVLSELCIDVIKRNDKVTIKYKGVVDVNNAFIPIYGVVNNYSDMFHRTIDTLESLTAELEVMYEDGELVSQGYNNQASIVYVDGKILSQDAIFVSYIALNTTTTMTDWTSTLCGIVDEINVEQSTLSLFVINSNHHQNIVLPCRDMSNIKVSDVVECVVKLQDYQHGHPPMYCEQCVKMPIKIDDNILQNAKKEYEIYQGVMQK